MELDEEAAALVADEVRDKVWDGFEVEDGFQVGYEVAVGDGVEVGDGLLLGVDPAAASVVEALG